MISYFLLLISIVFFVWGLINIMKGWHGIPGEDAVPLSDLEAVQDFNAGYSLEQKGLVSSGIKQETQAQRPPADEVIEDYKKKIVSLEEEIKVLSRKAVQQADEDHQRMTQIANERDLARKQDGENIRALEERIVLMRAEREQLLLSKEVVEELKSKNAYLLERDRENVFRIERLENDLLAAQREINEKQDKWHQTASDLKEEKESLFAEFHEKEEQLQKVRASLDLIEKTNNQRLNEANRAIDVLKAQRRESDRAQVEALERKLSDAIASAEVLRKEKEDLLQARASLEQNFQKVKEFNTHLIEKTKLLQYESTKQRAQALGLERVCEDFKIQIEEKYKSSIANFLKRGI
jgi:chromosome segregation ATPase